MMQSTSSKKQGWTVNFRSLCLEFDLSVDSTNCFFKQISVEEMKEPVDSRGLNVPISNGIRAAILFHLRPLIGEFFIVSLEGELVKAFVRARGTGYSPIPNAEMEPAFKKERDYWIENLSRLKSGWELERAKRGR